MAINFQAPSYRASSSDLTISISPLGLVELADEEFEVHGPRINRYSNNWAWYLGHHWAYRREAGEAQLTFNYCKALSDYITNFTFGKGVQYRSPKATEAIVPALLKRVWEEDNPKDKILWEMGQNGGVTGDCFVKVAYEEAYADPTGLVHPGRVRIIPLNSSFVFPEFHPHDRSRMIRCKIKYRFWGTSLEGTRSVFTYTELLTDDFIEEYINDELIDSRPNPIGLVPVVHIPNLPVASSPWGLSDIQDITGLNREYNEKATEISDIINYYSAPVTIITGAKAGQLERGAKKVWGGLPKDAKVYNLELGGTSGTEELPIKYLEMVKRAMHELTGVPETALGQMQPISNTSGVALSIQYQPLMNRYALKKIQYTEGLIRINALIMMHIALKEPEALAYDPTSGIELKDGQYPQLDPDDPVTYQSVCHWPSPLPFDVLIKLNELQMLMGMGLESKRGALRELGHEFPDEKLQEIFEEMKSDAMMTGSLDMIRQQINATIMEVTGMMPGDGGPLMEKNPETGAEAPVEGTGPAAPGLSLGIEEDMANQLLTQAYGTKLAQRRNPENENDDA